MKQNYIGFSDSDQFLAAVNKLKPINLNVGRKNGKPGKYGMAIDMTVVCLSQAQGDEVLYFQHATHKYQTLRGEIFDGDQEKPARLAEQVLAAAKQYLIDHGFIFREALLSMPINYITMDGDATFLKYSSEEGYSYKEVNSQ